MQIAYGKFDPELNPPPFSEWSKAFTAVEVDLFQYFSWKAKVKSYFQDWVVKNGLSIIPRFSIRTHRSVDEYLEATSIWKDQFASETIYFLVHSGRSHWSADLNLSELGKLPKSGTYFFEWGKEDTLKGVSFMSVLPGFGGYVIDPDWHRSSISILEGFPLHFKLHGWSNERWVRRYGISQAARILRHVRTRPQSNLILSYSGRIAEASLFRV